MLEIEAELENLNSLNTYPITKNVKLNLYKEIQNLNYKYKL
jgi:hypothetical protein